MNRAILKHLFVAGILTVFLSSSVSAQMQTGFTIDGDSGGDNFGWDVNEAGDVNGDGIKDFIVGAVGDANSTTPNTGSAKVLSGADGSLIHVVYGEFNGDLFGHSASGAGDVNNDGFDDFIVGAPNNSVSGFLDGRVQVFSGADGSVLYSYDGAPISGPDFFGWAVCAAGDINGDGFADFAASAPGQANAFQVGSVTIFSGADGNVLLTHQGGIWGNRYGYSINNAGDVNNDGKPDMLVGTPLQWSGAGIFGSLRVVSGDDGSVIHGVLGPTLGVPFGSDVSCAGDVDNDGCNDIVVGNVLPGNMSPSEICARVYSGADASLIFELNGNVSGGTGFVGSSVGKAGDVNGDGHDDVIVGSPLSMSGSGRTGSARVFSGRDGSIMHAIDGKHHDDAFGFSVSGAGDLNGDGFSDLLVGAQQTTANGSFTGSASVFFAPPMPILSYDSASMASDLSLEWAPDNGDDQSMTGSLKSTGGATYGTAAFGLSFAPADYQLPSGAPLLLAIDTTNLIYIGGITFDINGDFNVANVSRQHPYIAGFYVHVQFFQLAPFKASSNGVRMKIEM
ncbi:MAG: hypothetical protein ACI97A_001949 [Planctomycetota bacterium]|jgi:hypothetical protein